MSKFATAKQFINQIFGGAPKVSPTITKVDPFVPTTKAEKTARDLRRAVRARKTSEVKLDNTVFRIKQEKKKLEEQRDKNKKMNGGFMGKRMGYSKGTPRRKPNVEKIKKTFGTKKGLGMQSVIYGLDKNPNITAADPKAKFIAAANKKKKKKVV